MERRELQDRLVEAMLPHATFDGWSTATLEEAARDLDLPRREVARAFPGGPIDAVVHFVALIDRRMIAGFAATPQGNRVDERVFAAIQARLTPWEAHREAIRRALSLLALPANLPVAARLGWESADAVWRAIGDRDQSIARITKRATLSALLSATLLYWLEDTSEGAADTWAFLRRRLDDVRRLPRRRPGLATRTGFARTLLEKLPNPRKKPWEVKRAR